ncbi:MAG: GNAT family N-acetyltransferase, partial [Pseudomonadota bacterium]|nr:GNAT family N-acetyltransferase [Pseudomonadota bacterium]
VWPLALGVRSHRPFGPVIRFGHGGPQAAVSNDLACALPPLNMALARELLSRTRVHALLSSTDALALCLIKVAQLVIDLGEIEALDIDPLWADAAGVAAADAIIHIAPTQRRGTDRLAIRPYPKELEQTLGLPDGRAFLLRPILPEDAPRLQAMVRRAPAEDLRLRFFLPIRELSPTLTAQLTQIDYDREMAFVVSDPGVPGQADLWAVVHLAADPDLESAEYAILVDQRVTGLGLGPLLMRHLIDYARGRGIGEIYGEVLRENETMLRLNRALGFAIHGEPDAPEVMRVSLKL